MLLLVQGKRKNGFGKRNLVDVASNRGEKKEGNLNPSSEGRKKKNLGRKESRPRTVQGGGKEKRSSDRLLEKGKGERRKFWEKGNLDEPAEKGGGGKKKAASLSRGEKEKNTARKINEAIAIGENEEGGGKKKGKGPSSREGGKRGRGLRGKREPTRMILEDLESGGKGENRI